MDFISVRLQPWHRSQPILAPCRFGHHYYPGRGDQCLGGYPARVRDIAGRPLHRAMYGRHQPEQHLHPLGAYPRRGDRLMATLDQITESLQLLCEVPLNNTDTAFQGILPRAFEYAENRIYRELDLLPAIIGTVGSAFTA